MARCSPGNSIAGASPPRDGLDLGGPASTAGSALGRARQAGCRRPSTMGADGLDGVWIRPLIDRRRAARRVAGRPPAGAGRAASATPACRRSGDRRAQRRRAARAVPPIRASRGITYQVDIRHVHMAGGPAIDLAVTPRGRAARGTLVRRRRRAVGRPRLRDHGAPRHAPVLVARGAPPLAGMGAGLADRRARVADLQWRARRGPVRARWACGVGRTAPWLLAHGPTRRSPDAPRRLAVRATGWWSPSASSSRCRPSSCQSAPSDLSSMSRTRASRRPGRSIHEASRLSRRCSSVASTRA